MPAPEFFTDTYNGEMVRTIPNAYNTYFKLTGISDENNKPLFAKTRLSDTTRTWYDSQGYDETTVIFATVRLHILNYFIPSNYVKRARRHWLLVKWDKDRPQNI